MNDPVQTSPDPSRIIPNDPELAVRPCGCAARQAALNRRVPGLGDMVARIAEPVARALGWKR